MCASSMRQCMAILVSSSDVCMPHLSVCVCVGQSPGLQPYFFSIDAVVVHGIAALQQSMSSVSVSAILEHRSTSMDWAVEEEQ